MNRKAYLGDVSDEEWAIVALYLTLMTPAAPQRSYELQSTPESGLRAGYDGHKRKRGSKVHLAVDIRPGGTRATVGVARDTRQ